jgi:hypothetical protein
MSTQQFIDLHDHNITKIPLPHLRAELEKVSRPLSESKRLQELELRIDTLEAELSANARSIQLLNRLLGKRD